MQPLRGIALKVASVLVFIGMASLIKATAGHVPPGEAVFFRSFFAIPVILIWLGWVGQLSSGIRTAKPINHLWRGLISTCAMGFGFAGLGMLPLPEVTAIGYAAPLLVVIFAAMFLGEEVRLFRLSAVALGLVGVLIILSPRFTAVSGDEASERHMLGAIVVLFSALCSALAQVFVRKLVTEESTSAIVFWFSFTASCIALITVPFGWVVPTFAEAAALICAGLLGGVGQILLTSSYRHADASVIAPFEYASMLFALLIGYFVFDEVPTLVMVGGASLVILAGVLIIWRERALGIERARQRKAMTNGS
ncbi:MAG: DMT family transporter [Paracoccaceae bacterium]